MFTNMLDQPNAMGVSTLSPSEIPQVDEIIELLDLGSCGQRLQASFGELDQILGALYGIYLDELQFLAHDEPQNKAANQIASDFASVRPLVSSLRNDLDMGDWESASESAKNLKKSLQDLFRSFGDMRSQAREGPQYSEVPFTQELLRVAHHYLKGKLPLVAVQERLDAFCHYHDRLENRFEETKPSDAEASLFKARQMDLEEALTIQLQGIEDLDVALERRSDEAIKEALELLKVAADHLVEIYEALRQADLAPSTKSCFRCGATNVAEARLCSACQAVLPRFDADTTEGAQSTIVIKERTEATTGAVPEEYLRLEAAVEKALGTNDNAILVKQLEAFEGRLLSVQRQLDSLKAPPKDIPADHGAVLEEGKVRFADALETIRAGLELLHEGAPKLESLLLRRGLEEIGAGFDLMREFQELFHKAQELSEK